jgi:lipopolysaccharide/colanic/teichoic acid biosynthesis glycosyltransferase
MRKRLFDFFGSLFFLIIFSPLLVLIATLIWLTSGKPIIFKQERLGFKKKPFVLYKFRSMLNGSDKINRVVVEGDERITGIGRYLRKTHLDELPQLWNVFKGDMSLVGPRPLPPNSILIKLMENNPKHKNLFNVRPGLTGLTQIHGRLWAHRNFNEAVGMESEYVLRNSLMLDLKILLATITVVIRGQGV